MGYHSAYSCPPGNVFAAFLRAQQGKPTLTQPRDWGAGDVDRPQQGTSCNTYSQPGWSARVRPFSGWGGRLERTLAVSWLTIAVSPAA